MYMKLKVSSRIALDKLNHCIKWGADIMNELYNDYMMAISGGKRFALKDIDFFKARATRLRVWGRYSAVTLESIFEYTAPRYKFQTKTNKANGKFLGLILMVKDMSAKEEIKSKEIDNSEIILGSRMFEDFFSLYEEAHTYLISVFDEISSLDIIPLVYSESKHQVLYYNIALSITAGLPQKFCSYLFQNDFFIPIPEKEMLKIVYGESHIENGIKNLSGIYDRIVKDSEKRFGFSFVKREKGNYYLVLPSGISQNIS